MQRHPTITLTIAKEAYYEKFESRSQRFEIHEQKSFRHHGFDRNFTPGFLCSNSGNRQPGRYQWKCPTFVRIL